MNNFDEFFLRLRESGREPSGDSFLELGLRDVLQALAGSVTHICAICAMAVDIDKSGEQHFPVQIKIP